MRPADDSLVDIMLAHAGGADAAAGLRLWNTATRGYYDVSYRELTRRSFAFGARLVENGHRPGTLCLIACHSPYATLVAFYGAISAGSVPMIFPMPKALGSHQALVERIKYWGLRFDQPCVLVLEEGLKEKFHEAIPDGVATLRLHDSPQGRWAEEPAPAAAGVPRADDVAFFQTTSSSTGDHKAVAISHGNIVSNVRGIRASVDMDDDEKMISWLPLFHDMGLVGTVLFSFCNAYPLYLMTPTQFIKRPLLWLKGMSDHRCTITTAPNFGYDYCSRLVSDKDAAELDLSCVKHFFIGAEPIRVSTIRSFGRKFQPAGLGYDKIRPAYGLAESTIITTIARTDVKAGFVYLDAESIGLDQKVRVLGSALFDDAVLDQPPPAGAVAVCTAGTPIDDMQVTLVGEDGQPVAGDRYAGEIVMQGESVALGYVGDAGVEIDRFSERKAGTGDMGVFVDGQLFIIERIKNVIIRHGENFLVSAMEQRLADLLGISHENVAVFEADIHDPDSDIIVLIEKHAGLPADRVDALLADLPDENFPIDLVSLHRARVIPRTTSGKKRHFYCRRLHKRGELNAGQIIEVTPDKIAAASLRRPGAQ